MASGQAGFIAALTKAIKAGGGGGKKHGKDKTGGTDKNGATDKNGGRAATAKYLYGPKGNGAQPAGAAGAKEPCFHHFKVGATCKWGAKCNRGHEVPAGTTLADWETFWGKQ